MRAEDAPRRGADPWLGLGLAPAAFAAHLQLAYATVSWACATHREWWLHLIGAMSVALALVGVWAAARAARRPESRFLGMTGLGTSAVLTLLLIAQWAAVFIVTPCQ